MGNKEAVNGRKEPLDQAKASFPGGATGLWIKITQTGNSLSVCTRVEAVSYGYGLYAFEISRSQPLDFTCASLIQS